MLYFKNSELTTSHRIALNTVLNWIKAAQAGKLELELVTVKGRSYIVNNARNVQTIERLVADRRKYRNSRTARDVHPTPNFYKYFNESQILDIASTLDFNHELPRKYNYFDGGAEAWNDFVMSRAEDSSPNMVNGTVNLLNANAGYLNKLLEQYTRVNVIDIGVGNGLPGKQIVEQLLSANKLGRYIALDISPTMHQIARRNVDEWFGDQVKYEQYDIDIETQRFGHIVAEEYLQPTADQTTNVLLFLGGTLNNIRSPEQVLNNIFSSMGRRDILIHSQKLDSTTSRQLFDFNFSSLSSLPQTHRIVVELMGLDPSMYVVEMGFDPIKKQRFTRIKLVMALRMHFLLDGRERIVQLEKGDTILIWRAWQRDYNELVDLFTQNGFKLLQTSQLPGNDYIQTVSQATVDIPS